MQRIGVLINVAENDPAGQRRIAAFLQRLQELDWVEGRNLRIDMRWGAGDSDRYRRYAAELVALTPAAIFAVTTPAVAPLLHASRTVPIVFVSVVDPVGSGLVATLAQPGGNATGFSLFEYTISAYGWSCSKRSRPALYGSPCCGIPKPPESGSLRQSRPWHPST